MTNPEIHGCTGKHGSQVECDIVQEMRSLLQVAFTAIRTQHSPPSDWFSRAAVVLGLRNIRDEPYQWSPPETKERSPTGAELLSYGISIGVLPEGCDLLPYQFSAVFRRQIEAAWALRSPLEPSALHVEGSRLMMELFNRMPVKALKEVPEGIAKSIGDFMVANGYRFVFDRWYLQAEPKEPAKAVSNERCGPHGNYVCPICAQNRDG